MWKKMGYWVWQKKWWFAGLTVLIIGGLLFYDRQRQAAEPDYTWVNPEKRTITETLEVSGILDAKEKAQLHFAAASTLTWLGIDEGDRVEQWQGLARVDTRTLQKQMEINQNLHGKQFRSFENTLDSADYYGGSGLSESERRAVESAQLDLRNSALTVEVSDLAVKLSYLYSPIAGLVTRIDQQNVGALVLPTDVIEIVNPDTLYFLAVVDEQDVGLVHEQQQAEVILDAFEDQTITASVSSIAFAPSLGDTGGTGYNVEFDLPDLNRAQTYRLGMNGEVSVILAQKEEVLSVPIDSLVSRDEKTYVMVKEADTIVEKAIEIGIEDSEWVEVVSGLVENDAVAVPKNGD